MNKQIGYKVIEERLSPSGRIEYYTLPLYHRISDDEISGKVLFEPKESSIEQLLKKSGVECDYENFGNKKYVHAFSNYDSALEYMEKYFTGYIYTRPIIYECKCENIETNDDTNTLKCKSIKFLKPISQMVHKKVNEYVKMTLPERKKPHSISYDEDDINGDTDYTEE